MEVIKLIKDKYKEWDKFCMASDDAWFWHTTGWLEYNLNYRIDLKPESKSFFIINNNEIFAICLLVLEDYGDRKELSFGAIPCPVPAFSNNLLDSTKKKVMKLVFNEIDKIVKDNKISRANFRFSVLNKSFIEGSVPQNNYLAQFGFLDTSINTQVINLRIPENKLKKGLRKDHKVNIEKARQLLKIKIFDKNSMTRIVFNEYIELHHKAAGRTTRQSSTFDFMYNLIKDGNAFLVGAEKDGLFVGFSYFYLFKNNVYYGSSCNDPCVGRIPVSHLIQWESILWMCKNKFHFYEIGWQNYSYNLNYSCTQKELQISEFKRGFGGFTAPLFMGEKYYDKDFFLKTYDERIKNFAVFLDSNKD